VGADRRPDKVRCGMPGVVAGPVATPWAGTSGNRVVSLQRAGQYQRSYWIPGSSTPALSEKHNSFGKAMEKEGVQGGEHDQSRVVRSRQTHHPGIQPASAWREA
jgi:hypothetical protein